MKRLKTQVLVQRFIDKHGDEYDYSSTDSDDRDELGRVKIICKKHGAFWQNPMNHLRGSGCKLCHGTTKKTISDVVSEINGLYGSKYIIPSDFTYKSNKSVFTMVCPIHGEWRTSYSRLVTKGCGCKKCSCNIYGIESFREVVDEIYGDKFSYDEMLFRGFRTKVDVRCNNCGNVTSIFPRTLLDGNFKCECNSTKLTKLENDIHSLLESSHIANMQQYKPTWLRDKGQMSLDFYIPSIGIAIECQGRMHFEPFMKDSEKSLDDFKRQRKRDELKFKLCGEHGIEIIYYSDIRYDGEYMSRIYNSIDEINKLINFKIRNNGR